MFFLTELQENKLLTLVPGGLRILVHSMGQSSHLDKPKGKGYGSVNLEWVQGRVQ